MSRTLIFFNDTLKLADWTREALRKAYPDLLDLPARKRDKEGIRECVFANLLNSHRLGLPVGYSRGHWGQNRHVIELMDILIKRGWVEHVLGYYDLYRNTRKTSTAKPIGDFADQIDAILASNPNNRHPLRKPITMQNAVRLNHPNQNTVSPPGIRDARLWVLLFNKFLRSAHVEYHGKKLKILDPAVYRVFTGSYEGGGRFYGGEHQGLEGGDEARSHIRIDGEPVIEYDYGEFHARMLYHLFKQEAPEEIYRFFPDQTKNDRELLKVAFQIIVNTKTEKGAISALQNNMNDESKALSNHWSAQQIVEAFLAAHPVIFPKDRKKWIPGVRLQYLDSFICAEICDRLMSMGIHALPVHDSFVVKRRHGKILWQVMDEVYREQLSGFVPVIKAPECYSL